MYPMLLQAWIVLAVSVLGHYDTQGFCENLFSRSLDINVIRWLTSIHISCMYSGKWWNEYDDNIIVVRFVILICDVL